MELARPDCRRVVSGLLAIGLSVSEDEGWSAPITFYTALPVAQGQFVFREQFVFGRSSGDPGPEGREMESLGAVSVLGFGATRDFALFGVLPYLDHRLELGGEGENRTRSARGIGDFSLFGRYTLVQMDWPQRTFRLAPFAGVEMPTGAARKSDALGRLPPGVQVGSGSWDPFFGVVATYQTLEFQVDAQLGYHANNEAHEVRLGDVAQLDASLQYRLWPRALGGGVPGFLYGVVEANLIHQDKNTIGGARDPDSGGTTLFIAPGLQYVTRRWIVEAAVQLPAVQALNGKARENDYIVHAGFRVNF